MELHEHKKHGKPIKLDCTQCDASFASKKNLNYHFERRHAGRRVDEVTGELIPLKSDYDPNDKVICPRCNGEFHRRSLKKHILRFHEKMKNVEGEKKHKCLQCKFAEHSLSKLKKHVRVVHDKIKDAACQSCPYKTINQRLLKVHVRFYHEKYM